MLLLVSSASVYAAAAETTRGMLDRYGRELAEVWEKFPAETQKQVRAQSITDINTAFGRDITKPDPPANLKLAPIFSAYLDNLMKVHDLFKTEKMKAERTAYVRACSTVFKRESMAATDFNADRTAQRCFSMLLDWCEEARDRFVQEKNKDLRTDAYSQINTLFSDLLKNAKFAENIDHAVQMDKNLKEAKLRFPTTPPMLSAKNLPVMQICENAVKSIKAKSAQK